MDSLAQNLRAAAARLSLSDAEVARRLAISQQRLAHYLNGKRRPDYTMLLRMCEVLATSPNELLGFATCSSDDSAISILRARIWSAAAAMDEGTLRQAATVMDALADDRNVEQPAAKAPKNP